MLIDRDCSLLLLVDIQQRLLPHMADWQRLLENNLRLVKMAQDIGVPVGASEQYPRGLGHTHEALRALLPAQAVAEKLHFSCARAQCIAGLPGGERQQVVITGIESHVCVLQTAVGLREQGRDVFVVADCVASREPANKALALERMRAHGIDIVSLEMVGFEWLGEAGTDLFRRVSSAYLR